MRPPDPLRLNLDLEETLIDAADEPLPWPADFARGPWRVCRRPCLEDFARVDLLQKNCGLAALSARKD